MKFYKGFIKSFSKPDQVFVVGTNLDGAHAGGAAKVAFEHFGAIWGVGEGLTGQTYALPTLGHGFSKMPMREVREHVRIFLGCVKTNPHKTFWLTPVGTGIAGLSFDEVASLFVPGRDLPNLIFPEVFLSYLNPRDSIPSQEVFP